MRKPLLLAAVLLVSLTSAGVARAEYGAFAYDAATGKYGFSWNEKDQRIADQNALKDCPSGGCKIVFRVGPRRCGAIATTENGKIWGGADRDQRDAAKLAAVENCQKRTKEQCIIRGNECNR